MLLAPTGQKFNAPKSKCRGARTALKFRAFLYDGNLARYTRIFGALSS